MQEVLPAYLICLLSSLQNVAFKEAFFLTYSIAKHHLKQTVQFYLTLAVPAEYSSGNEIIAG